MGKRTKKSEQPPQTSQHEVAVAQENQSSTKASNNSPQPELKIVAPAEFTGDLTVLDSTVFPSDEKTIAVEPDPDYGGAHCYHIKNCVGFNNGKTGYVPEEQTIQFVQKNADGSIIPGLQSEQLVLMLIDRHTKLNAKYPDPRFDRLVGSLRAFLQAAHERVQERIDRGVMGELKK